MKSQARLRLRRPVTDSVMVRVLGAFYRCRCGANVFTKRGRDQFVCNGCGEAYEGTR